MIHFLLPDRWGARESVTLNLPPQPRKRSAPSQLPKSPGVQRLLGVGFEEGWGLEAGGSALRGHPWGLGDAGEFSSSL